jgi:excisionase family DNA binding protein
MGDRPTEESVRQNSATLGEPRHPEWLGLRQAACYASVCERTLRAWIHSPIDPLPAVRVSGKILLRRSELDRWLETHRLQPAAALNLDTIVKDALRGIADGRQSSKA